MSEQLDGKGFEAELRKLVAKYSGAETVGSIVYRVFENEIDEYLDGVRQLAYLEQMDQLAKLDQNEMPF